jgi:integrase
VGTIATRRDSQGNVSYQAKIRKTGHAPMSATFPTRELADAWMMEKELDIYRGKTVVSERGSKVTLGEIVQRYLAEVTPTHKGAIGERMHMRAIENSSLVRYALVNLKPEHVKAWKESRLKEVSPATVIRQMNLLHAVIEHARKEWGISGGANPVSDVSRPPQPPSRDRRLSHEEKERLIAECRRTRGNYLEDVVLMALETAMRMSEMLDLQWEQVDLQRRTIRLKEGTTKNGEGRAVPISSRLREVLERREPNPEYRFGPMFHGVTQNACTRAFQRAAERAGLEDLHFHDLRHEATSRLFEHGLNVMEAASITGHKDLRMLKRYTHLDASKLADKLG